MRGALSSSRRCGASAFLIALPLAAAGQSADDVNKANNPLAPTVGLSVQDYYTGRLYGLGDADANSLLARGTMPHKLGGHAQILRATLPVVTTPDLPPAGRRTGVGDLNLFNLFLFKEGALEVGIGPQLTIPTASRDETGTGKWQAGLAAALIAPQKWGLLGGLVTWQQSFAGSHDRADVSSVTAQPFVIANLPDAWYLRSSAAATFNLRDGSYAIPLGLGVGKVWKSGTTTVNVFAEPQWTVAHDGDGQPKFQFYFGLNLQFPL